VKAFHGLDDLALIDMGDFVGGMLKYLRRHPVPRVTIAGGFAKMTKLAQGRLDLHSGRSQVDFAWLAQKLTELGASGQLLAHARAANTAREVLEMAGAAQLDIAPVIAACARETAERCVAGAVSPIDVDVLVVNGSGEVIAHAGER